MLTSLLIANRGEIALRIIRTARRLGIRTAAVYSEADAAAPHVREADSAMLIGPAPAARSYLDGDRVIAAAKELGAEAIHPGYGFLSENADFAEAVMTAGLIWVGPPPAAIRAMGLKDAAKRLMAAAGVPTTPGYLGEEQSDARLASEAKAIGLPVLIKAVAGGGGKGMRRVDRPEDFAAALAAARREAKAAFGDDKVLLETYVRRPRHIEVQVFGDRHGNVVHLFERDCSLQRRHQKVIEEAPAPGMDPAAREAVCGAALMAARAVDYVGAGTVEFIADASEGLRPDRIWFMEMNTRLQVEHPVTEAVTGLDLVEWQLRIASGEPLPLKQEEVRLSGHAIEARLYAEAPATGFMPSTGRLRRLELPDGLVRVDAGVEAGAEVTGFYDPMIAKLIAHAPTRQEAAARAAEACRAVQAWPVKTNAAFLARCLDHEDFRAGEVDTGFIETHLQALISAAEPPTAVLRRAAAARLKMAGSDPSPWSALKGFRVNGPAQGQVRLECAGRIYELALRDAMESADAAAVPLDGQIVVFGAGEAYAFADPSAGEGREETSGDGALVAPMPGKVAAAPVKVGDRVEPGDTVVVLEAMKMEHALTAPFAATVAELNVEAGEQVSEGALLARLDKAG